MYTFFDLVVKKVMATTPNTWHLDCIVLMSTNVESIGV